MKMTDSEALDFIDHFKSASERVKRSMDRQCRTWRGEKLDTPVVFTTGTLTPEQEKIPDYDYREAFNDKSKMLCSQIRSALKALNGCGDTVPSIRANMGTGILLACVGLEQETYPDKMPWLHEHLTKKQVACMTPDDIRPQGSFAKGLEMMRYFKETLGDALPVFVMDTQGPFDLAHLMMGDEIFLQIYDDPPFMHHLMNLCLELGTRTHRWMKEAAGEPLTSLHHSNSLYSDSFGIRICEDTTVLIMEEHIREFAIPYSRKLAKEFGGAWVHYCGYNEALTKAILEAPELKVLNFGHIPGHEQEIAFYTVMEKFEQAGKVNYNGWPKFPGESDEDHFARMLKYAKKGVLAPIVPDPILSKQSL